VLRRASRGLAPWLFVVAAGALLFAACGDDDGASADATPEAAALVAAAAERMEQVRSFHFELEHENGSTEIVRGIEMTRAEGDIVGTDRLRVEVAGSAGPFDFELGIIILPEQSWIQNPLTRRWEREDITVEELFDPATGVVALMRSATELAIEGRERVRGVETYRVATEVESGELTVFPGAEPGRRVPATAWIGVDEPLVHRLEVRGPIGGRDEEDVVRRLELSDFDADFDIAPPR
jgi:hypothetical protein